jgi:GNAT superfamily N-acetyltransferase
MGVAVDATNPFFLYRAERKAVIPEEIGHDQQNCPGQQEVTIRPFAEQDAAQVRELFITVNRLLSPPDLRAAFEVYIERALAEEIDRISAYYGERNGGFWVAVRGDDKVVGTFGLERVSAEAMELRRMYVDPSVRRQGTARQMLHFAENECRRRRMKRLELSTLKYSGPRSHYTGTRDIDRFA